MIYIRFLRWSRTGVFNKIFRVGSQGRQARSTDEPQSARDGGQPAQKGSVQRCIGSTKGGLSSNINEVCNGECQPLILLLSKGQMSDYKGTALMPDAFPKANVLLGDCGYDTDWFRHTFMSAIWIAATVIFWPVNES